METSGKNKFIQCAWNQGAGDLRTEKKKSPEFEDQDSEKNHTVNREQSVEAAVCNQDKRRGRDPKLLMKCPASQTKRKNLM